jgi:hypothetical protein
MRERCCVVSGTERVLLLLYSVCTINIPKLAVPGCKAHVLASYLYALPSIGYGPTVVSGNAAVQLIY